MSMRDKKMIHHTLVVSALMILALPFAAFGAEPETQIRTELPQVETPQPQMFCGYCHILTYPSVVNKGYELWKKGKHNQFGCVECHYPPGESKAQASEKAGVTTETKHIPKKPPERFSYLPLGGESVQTIPRIVDASCMTANCHGKPDDKFKTKKIKYTEKVSFVHEPHLDKTKQIEGQKIQCTSCHQHETEAKKFEVSQASCHLCHFTNVKFNEGRARCELCHTLPEKPIQTSGQEPITHEMLKKEKVSCGGCHYDLVQASGRASYEAYFEAGVLKTAIVVGAGYIKKENCSVCHDQAKDLKEVENKKLMHEKHVTVKTARCFDCHQPIMHKKADLKQPVLAKAVSDKSVGEKIMSDPFIKDSCAACHPEPHRLQRLLQAGLERKGVPETPGFHFTARANCMACHVEEGFTEKGEKILKASAKACIACHPGRETLLKDWNTDLENVTKETMEVEKEAVEALAQAEPKLSKEKVDKAKKMLQEGRETLDLVRFGNGVHNKKYSMFVLDAAITHFEDLLDYLEEGN